jgi:hypothetical protein
LVVSWLIFSHIAAHGIASAKFPGRAALVLGNDPKSGEDGLLQVREIRDLNLAADLVTLSACDTGVGVPEGEEGIAKLVRSDSSRFLDPGPRRHGLQLCRGSARTVLPNLHVFPQHGIDRGLVTPAAFLEKQEDVGIEPQSDFPLSTGPQYCMFEKCSALFRDITEVDIFVPHGLDALPVTPGLPFRTLRVHFAMPFSLK